MPSIKDESNPRLSSGKVPSYLLPNGTTALISGRDGWSTDDLKAQIQLAQDHGKSFGIAIQPPKGLVIIDLDVTNYPGGQSELLEDYSRLLRKTPDLKQTRTETTTNGGPG
jgi:hypothetical protein